MLRDPATSQVLLRPNMAGAPLVVNEAFYRQEALISVVDSTLSSPPAGPHQPGRAFLVLGTPLTGAWAGLGNYIVVWAANQWKPIAGKPGMRVHCAQTNTLYVFVLGIGWLADRGVIDYGSFGSGTVTMSGDYGTTILMSTTGAFALDVDTTLMLSGKIYTAIIKNLSGASRTISLTSGSWVHTASSIAVADKVYHCLRYTILYDYSRAIILSSRASNHDVPI